MIRVPIYEPQVRDTGIPNARLNVNVTADAFGAGIADGLAQAATSTQRIQGRYWDQANQVGVLEAKNKYDAKATARLQQAAMVRGKDAVGQTDKVLGDLSKDADALLNELPNQAQRDMFTNYRLGREGDHRQFLDDHALKEVERYDENQYKANG